MYNFLNFLWQFVKQLFNWFLQRKWQEKIPNSMVIFHKLRFKVLQSRNILVRKKSCSDVWMENVKTRRQSVLMKLYVVRLSFSLLRKIWVVAEGEKIWNYKQKKPTSYDRKLISNQYLFILTIILCKSFKTNQNQKFYTLVGNGENVLILLHIISFKHGNILQ